MPESRKYTTEFTIVVSVEGLCLLRAQDLRNIDLADVPGVEACHLYVITRSPRVSVEPSSVNIEDGKVSGIARVHRQAELEEVPFQFELSEVRDGLSWRSSWPHEDFRIEDSSGETVLSGVCANLSLLAQAWPISGALHEILYVGQAFGADGERTAWDRLRSHETLQRILADQTPDMQIWLTMAHVFDVQVLQEIAPFDGRISGKEDLDHVMAVMKATYGDGFKRRESVALAEAGLIRGWQPEYNDKLKYKFPARKQVSLETVRKLDMFALVVEWQSLQLPIAYWCTSWEPHSINFFSYEVHCDEERGPALRRRTPAEG